MLNGERVPATDVRAGDAARMPTRDWDALGASLATRRATFGNGGARLTRIVLVGAGAWWFELPSDRIVERVACWMMVSLLAYIYLGFPLLVYLRARFFLRPIRAADGTPTLSMLIACHNEAGQIEAKLENVLSLDYPVACLQVVVASDGSTDTTESLIEAFIGRGVGPLCQLLRLPRGGKARALNAAAAVATGEIWVFTDANSILREDALRALVRPFADPEGGGVAGDQRYVKATHWSGLQAGEYDYWSHDRWLKTQLSRGGSVTSATGALYAIRRDCFQPLGDGMTDDFLASTRVVAAGKRLVFAPDAVACETVALTGRDEFLRKVRLMSRGLRGVLAMRRLFNPFRYGFYSLQLLSHKVLRRWAVFAWLSLLLLSLLLWDAGWVYRTICLTFMLVLIWALVGCLAIAAGWHAQGRLTRRLLTWPAFFLIANTAALLATWKLMRGQRFDLWQPRRGKGTEVQAS